MRLNELTISEATDGIKNKKFSIAELATDCLSAIKKNDKKIHSFLTVFDEHALERAKYLYAIARAIAKNSRLFAVLESLDNGKTIRETRDIDIPLVVRHFYYHAGWAEIVKTEFPNYNP